MPVRERPESTPPSLRPSLRAGFESCARSNEDILQDVFSSYFVNVDEDTLRDDTSGRTLMLQDLRNRWSLADVLGVFDELGAEHVEYVFLPLSVWETKSKARDPLKKSQCRNKAYCFVHFSDVAASQAFVDRLNRYELPKGETPEGTVVREKKVHASFSSTQGIVPNLLRLVDIHSRRWHPRAGELALRLGERLVACRSTAPSRCSSSQAPSPRLRVRPCLQRQRSPSFHIPFFGGASRPLRFWCSSFRWRDKCVEFQEALRSEKPSCFHFQT